MNSTTVTCPECGQENSPGTENCTNCGMSLNPAEEGIEPRDGDEGNQNDD